MGQACLSHGDGGEGWRPEEDQGVMPQMEAGAQLHQRQLLTIYIWGAAQEPPFNTHTYTYMSTYAHMHVYICICECYMCIHTYTFLNCICALSYPSFLK